jgi:hypothetical protein
MLIYLLLTIIFCLLVINCKNSLLDNKIVYFICYRKNDVQWLLINISSSVFLKSKFKIDSLRDRSKIAVFSHTAGLYTYISLNLTIKDASEEYNTKSE